MKAKLRRALGKSAWRILVLDGEVCVVIYCGKEADIGSQPQAEIIRDGLTAELQEALESSVVGRIRKAAQTVTDRLDLPDEIRDPVAETVRELLRRLDRVEEHDAMVDDKRDGE